MLEKILFNTTNRKKKGMEIMKRKSKGKFARKDYTVEEVEY